MLAPGRVRGLDACATAKGIFTILAADHRDALRVMVDPAAPERVPAETLTEIKLDIVGALGGAASAVLLDPLYSARQAVARNVLPEGTGLLCALEEQGYLGDTNARETRLLPGWSVEQAQALGAAGVKLLLLYHPDSPAAPAQEELVRGVLDDCARWEIPLFLEPISYSLDSSAAKGSAAFARERKRIVLESVRRLGAFGPDVLKVEFPLDATYEHDEGVWAEACAELDRVSPVPWALLSAAEPFDTFKRQLEIACENGCSGFLAGRAVWREAAKLAREARIRFLRTTAHERFGELCEIAASAKPWQEHTNKRTGI